MYVLLSRLPKPVFYTLATILLPVIGLVDGIGFLTGLMKVGPKETWKDDLIRITHRARKIEIGIGLMGLAYFMFGALMYWVMIVVWVPGEIQVAPIATWSLIATLYTLIVWWWSARNDVDPINGARFFPDID